MKNTLEKKNYENYISLGFFCSVAIDIQEFGLRDFSYPFDWLITSKFEKVISLISSSFDGFMEYDNMYQNRKKREQYKDIQNDISFYHDFSPFKSFDIQYRDVKEKYKRRIERFYNNIKNPTLFIRYIRDIDELRYIEKKYDDIDKIIKGFCPENDIIFIANDNINSSIITLYNVPIDSGDVVSRHPFKSNHQLEEFFKSVNNSNYEKNISFLNKKHRDNKIDIFMKKLKYFLSKKYKHKKTY